MTRLERFMSHVDPQPDGCWRWRGAHYSNGYARWEHKGERNPCAHRAGYLLIVGPIPDGLELDHLCRNRWCVAPHHLEPVTRAENLRRSPIAFAGINAAKTECVNGHPFTPENTILRTRPGGGRECRTCRDARVLARREVAA